MDSLVEFTFFLAAMLFIAWEVERRRTAARAAQMAEVNAILGLGADGSPGPTPAARSSEDPRTALLRGESAGGRAGVAPEAPDNSRHRTTIAGHGSRRSLIVSVDEGSIPPDLRIRGGNLTEKLNAFPDWEVAATGDEAFDADINVRIAHESARESLSWLTPARRELLRRHMAEAAEDRTELYVQDGAVIAETVLYTPGSPDPIVVGALALRATELATALTAAPRPAHD